MRALRPRRRISCCAADATALSVVVDAPLGARTADQWVEVIGHAAPATTNPAGGYAEPAITPVSITEIDAPEEQYER